MTGPGYWDRQAPEFDHEPDHGLLDPATRGEWTRLLESVLPAPPARIADLGCGTGTLAVLLAQLGHDVRGCDFSPAMIDRAQAKAAMAGVVVTFTVADAAAPPWPAASCDCVLSRHVLWALPDPAAALEGWRALLAPGGRLVLIEGRWSTGVGIAASDAAALVHEAGREPVVTPLTDPLLWGGPIADERYLLVA